MTSHSNISFRKREDADEIYTFPYQVNEATQKIDNSVVMVEYQTDGQALIIAGNLPGMIGYYDNYPDVEDEEKQRKHEFSQELLDEAKEFVEEYGPETSSSKSHSGNRSLRDLYVEVEREKRDEVVMGMWQMLNYMKSRYIDFLEESGEDEHLDYPSLEEEVLEISKTLDCN